MADTLEIFGDEFINVTGIKATNDNDEVIIFYHAIDGNNLSYGLINGSLPLVGIAQVDSAHVWDSAYTPMALGTGAIGTGRVM